MNIAIKLRLMAKEEAKGGQVFILAIEADSSLSRNKDTICISNKYGLSWVAS